MEHIAENQMTVNKGIDLTRYPSIVAVHPASTVSDKYSFVPTMPIVETLAKHGWYASRASEDRVRREDYMGFQKHLIRFRQNDIGIPVNGVDNIIPEIVLKNAHNGFGYYEFMAGIFRQICLNGLMVCDSMFASVKIKHIGYVEEAVVQAIDQVLETVPAISSRVTDWSLLELNPDEQRAFALASAVAKYGDVVGVHRDMNDVGLVTVQAEQEGRMVVDLDALRTPTRRYDRIYDGNGNANNSLWNTYNVVQEKLVEKGGRITRNPKTHRVVKSRKINSISENVRVNKALWTLADEMAKLKK